MNTHTHASSEKHTHTEIFKGTKGHGRSNSEGAWGEIIKVLKCVYVCVCVCMCVCVCERESERVRRVHNSTPITSPYARDSPRGRGGGGGERRWAEGGGSKNERERGVERGRSIEGERKRERRGEREREEVRGR